MHSSTPHLGMPLPAQRSLRGQAALDRALSDPQPGVPMTSQAWQNTIWMSVPDNGYWTSVPDMSAGMSTKHNAPRLLSLEQQSASSYFKTHERYFRPWPSHAHAERGRQAVGQSSQAPSGQAKKAPNQVATRVASSGSRAIQGVKEATEKVMEVAAPAVSTATFCAGCAQSAGLWTKDAVGRAAMATKLRGEILLLQHTLAANKRSFGARAFPFIKSEAEKLFWSGHSADGGTMAERLYRQLETELAELQMTITQKQTEIRKVGC